jgi:hypothetical protein
MLRMANMATNILGFCCKHVAEKGKYPTNILFYAKMKIWMEPTPCRIGYE